MPTAITDRLLTEKEAYDRGLLTRRQVADLMGVIESTVLRWERSGLITPIKCARTGHGHPTHTMYDPRTLTKIAVRKEKPVVVSDVGELAARVFEMLDEGRSVRDIVVRLRQTPSTIETFRAQWEKLGDGMIMISSDMRTKIAALVGDFDGPDALRNAIARRLDGGNDAGTIDIDDPTGRFEKFGDDDIEHAIIHALGASRQETDPAESAGVASDLPPTA